MSSEARLQAVLFEMLSIARSACADLPGLVASGAMLLAARPGMFEAKAGGMLAFVHCAMP